MMKLIHTCLRVVGLVVQGAGALLIFGGVVLYLSGSGGMLGFGLGKQGPILLPGLVFISGWVVAITGLWLRRRFGSNDTEDT